MKSLDEPKNICNFANEFRTPLRQQHFIRMRYLGNKESLVEHIRQMMGQKGLLRKENVFFDAFCGMGAVSAAVDGLFHRIVVNDLLKCCVTFTRGRLVADRCRFETLGFNPLEHLNGSDERREGFFFHNYSPGGAERMYFTEENAARIDYFRWQIEEWKNADLITDDEYTYLLACLLESVSKVSNTAGVYGAFLKTWDGRALKPIEFLPVSTCSMFSTDEIVAMHGKVEDVIADVDCDILYLDPPYTQNQYGTQYHLLETLTLNDEPSLSRVTGSRPVTPLRSDWSKNHKCHILLDKVVAETKAKHILLSYNNDGFMSKDYIEATLKRYGKADTYDCQVIQYKKYNNRKCQGAEGHYEYLFYIEKATAGEVIESPLNYTGSKSKMIDEIRRFLPKDIDTFVDVFGGGFNVGINIDAKRIIYNDINPFVVGLMQSFAEQDTCEYLDYIDKKIEQYGLAPNNKEAYNSLREAYNSTASDKRDPKMLYTLILYGFQQQIRFNGSHEFNNPSGSRWFNDKLLSKFVSFARVSRCKQDSIVFLNMDFVKLLQHRQVGTFLYLDPPYRSTTGAYNDGKRGFQGWTRSHEERMCRMLDDADSEGNRFMLSYVLENKGFFNEELYRWAKSRKYKIVEVEETQGKYNNRKEVLIMNYKAT